MLLPFIVLICTCLNISFLIFCNCRCHIYRYHSVASSPFQFIKSHDIHILFALTFFIKTFSDRVLIWKLFRSETNNRCLRFFHGSLYGTLISLFLGCCCFFILILSSFTNTSNCFIKLPV